MSCNQHIKPAKDINQNHGNSGVSLLTDSNAGLHKVREIGENIKLVLPGQGKLPYADDGLADANIAILNADIYTQGVKWGTVVRDPMRDNNGMFAYTLSYPGLNINIQIPGMKLDDVRFTGKDEKNTLDYPRISVDGVFYAWDDAVQVIKKKVETDAPATRSPASLNNVPSFQSNQDFAKWLNQLEPENGWTDEICDAYRFAMCFDEPQDIEHVKQVMGFVARVSLALRTDDGWDSEALTTDGDGDKARLFIWDCDFTKTYSDDIYLRFYNYDEDGFESILREGSPIRKTDRAGAGTKGTRLVEGIKSEYVFAFS